MPLKLTSENTATTALVHLYYNSSFSSCSVTETSFSVVVNLLPVCSGDDDELALLPLGLNIKIWAVTPIANNGYTVQYNAAMVAGPFKETPRAPVNMAARV